MLVSNIYDDITDKLKNEWINLLKTLHKEELKSIKDGDRLLFHGTDALSAEHILDKGFSPSFLSNYVEGHMDDITMEMGYGIYWGRLNIATSFAERNAESDSPPALFWIKESNLIKQGIPCPDYYSVESGSPSSTIIPFSYPKMKTGIPMTYTESMDITGAMTLKVWDNDKNSLNGNTDMDTIKIQGLNHYIPSPELLDIHKAENMRKLRMDSPYFKKPHPNTGYMIKSTHELDEHPICYHGHH